MSSPEPFTMKSMHFPQLLTVLIFVLLQGCSSLPHVNESEGAVGKVLSDEGKNGGGTDAQASGMARVESSDSTIVANISRATPPVEVTTSTVTIKPKKEPVTRSVTKPVAKSAVKPEAKPVAKSAVKPAVKPAVTDVTKSVLKPGVKSESSLATQQVETPAWILAAGRTSRGEVKRFEKRAIARDLGGAVKTELIVANGVPIEMVRVPGGVFPISSLLGIYDSLPVKSAYIRSFMVGRFEVSQQVWQAVMGFNPSHNSSCAHCPVNSISWVNIQEFISRLNRLTGRNFRLISELEFEYSCRSGEGEGLRKGYCGSDNEDSLSWYSVRSPYEQKPVGELPLQDFQLYNAKGRGIGWGYNCWDGSYYVTPPEYKGAAPDKCNGGALRGGAWYYEDRFLGSTYPLDTDVLPNRYIVYGIRLAHDI